MPQLCADTSVIHGGASYGFAHVFKRTDKHTHVQKCTCSHARNFQSAVCEGEQAGKVMRGGRDAAAKQWGILINGLA